MHEIAEPMAPAALVERQRKASWPSCEASAGKRHRDAGRELRGRGVKPDSARNFDFVLSATPIAAHPLYASVRACQTAWRTREPVAIGAKTPMRGAGARQAEGGGAASYSDD